VLRVLVREAGRGRPAEQLLREVWAQRWLGRPRPLDMHISWLRRKLGDDVAKTRAYIKTVRGVGFRFERGD